MQQQACGHARWGVQAQMLPTGCPQTLATSSNCCSLTCMAHRVVACAALPGIMGGGSLTALVGTVAAALPPLSPPCRLASRGLLPPAAASRAAVSATFLTAVCTTPASSSARAWWPVSEGLHVLQRNDSCHGAGAAGWCCGMQGKATGAPHNKLQAANACA